MNLADLESLLDDMEDKKRWGTRREAEAGPVVVERKDASTLYVTLPRTSD